MITWLSAKEKNGIASFYQNNITLNTTAMAPLDFAYKVQVGIDDNQNVIIKPFNRNVVESGELDECCILNIEIHKSFARVSSAHLLKQISESLKLPLSKKPLRFETSWDNNENILVINIKGGQKV